MRYPAAETAEKHRQLLTIASTLFRQRGVEDVSVSEVMKAAGMTHGAFYSHFASKDDLVSAAIQEAAERSASVLEEVLATSTGAKDRYLQRYLSHKHRDQNTGGCLMAALATEIGRRGSDKPTMSRYIGRLLDRVTSGFGWGRRGTQRDQAVLMVAAMVGALILSRSVDDPSLSDEILDATYRQLTAA